MPKNRTRIATIQVFDPEVVELVKREAKADRRSYNVTASLIIKRAYDAGLFTINNNKQVNHGQDKSGEKIQQGVVNHD